MSSRVLFEGRSVTASRPRYAQVWVVWASIVRSSAPSVICTLRGFADSAPRDSQREDPVSRSDWRSPPGPEADMSAGPTDKQRGAPLRRLPSCRRTWWFAYARTGVWRRPRAPCIRRSASVGGEGSVADPQWRARRGRAGALLGMGDKPGPVVEVANEAWDSSRLAQRAAACPSRNVHADRRLCTRCEGRVCDRDGRDVINGERSGA